MAAQICKEESALPYNSLTDEIVEESKKKTDFTAFVIYSILSIIWVGTALLGFSERIRLRHSLKAEKEAWQQYSLKYHTTDNDNNFNDNLPLQATLIVFGFYILALLLSIIYLKLVKNYTKILIRVALGVLYSTLVCLITTIFYDGGVWIDVGTFIVIITFMVVTALAVKYRKEINYATETIAEAAKTVCLSPSHFWVAFIEFPLVFACWLLCLYNAFWLKEVSYILKKERILLGPTFNNSYLYFLTCLKIINFFVLMWTICFIHGVKYMTLAGSFSTWFSASKKNEVPSKPVQGSLNTAGKYHLGTIAFGSIIKAVCLLIVTCFISFIAPQSSTKYFTFLLHHFLLFTIWICLMDFVMYLGRSAYAHTAISGTDLKTSAKEVYSLTKENFGKFTLTIQVSYLLFVLGAIFIIGIPVFLLYVTKCDDYVMNSLSSAFNFDGTTHKMMAVLIPIMLTYSIFDTLNAGVETILICKQILHNETSQNFKTLLLNESA